jgi:hypothetical protein
LSTRPGQLGSRLLKVPHLLPNGCQLPLNTLQLSGALAELVILRGDPTMFRIEVLQVALETGRLLAESVLLGS